jgi:hypothetical protein
MSFLAHHFNLNDFIPTGEILSSEVPLSERIQAWNDLFASTPEAIKNKKGLVLVHGIVPENLRCIQMLALLDLHESGKGTFDHNFNIDLLRDPERICDKPIISTSCIELGGEKNETFGSGGFILTAPFENIVEMAHEDVGTNFANPTSLKAQPETFLTPEELMLRTGYGKTTYNEITLKGRTEAGVVKIAGVFIRINGLSEDKEMNNRLVGLAYRLKVPLTVTDDRKPTGIFESPYFKSLAADLAKDYFKER